MRNMFWAICFSFFLLTGCVEQTANLETVFKPDDNNIFRDSFSIRDKTIPLPEGEWKIISSGFDSDNFFYVVLIQEHPGEIFSYVTVQVDSIQLNREGGNFKNKDLERSDMLRVFKHKNVQGEPVDGWFINNFIPTFTAKDSDSQFQKDASRYVASHKLIISDDMILVSHLFTGSHPYKKRLLRVRYAYNPEAAGFSPSPKSSWSTSEWNAVRFNTDPQKVAYIDELTEKHTLIHEQIKAGFHKSSAK